jgi:two-component system catabolic regulation response regulator CreB
MPGQVFVVDDDPGLLRVARVLLEQDGFQVQPFASAGDALANLSDPSVPNPAAILLDLNMPDMDGREFYRRAREAGYTDPVLILSAYGAHAAREELGAEAAVPKPFDPAELSSALRTILPG